MDIKSGIIKKNSFIGSNPLNVNNKVLAEYIYIYQFAKENPRKIQNE